MAPLSEEEENYVRLALLLKGVSPRAVRSNFDKEFPPTYLPSILNRNYNTLNDLYLKRILNQVQWDLLFPKKIVPDSKTFDVTLMICLIRNLTNVIPPIHGFDKLPQSMETTIGSDLARIKWYRNILAHHDSNKITTAYFNTAWADVSFAVGRLGGQTMNQECQDLKVKFLDQSNQEIIFEIKQSQEEINELRKTIDTLGTEHSIFTKNLRELQNSNRTLQAGHSTVSDTLKYMQDSQKTFQIKHSTEIEILKDTIPWNIKVGIKKQIETWEKEDEGFIETKRGKRVLKCIKKHSCVVVTGSSGMGKSSLVRHVALQIQREGYDILPVSKPNEIKKWYKPNKKILFVVDDFCGTYTLNPFKHQNWKYLMDTINTFLETKQVKLIMSCRLQVYQDEKLKLLSFFQSFECNLLSEDMCLLQAEKQSIAEFYLKTNAFKISELYDMFDCFPLLCQLYSKNMKLDIIDFFKNPFTVYKDEIDQLQTEGAQGKYCALALCVMFNNSLKEEWLSEDVDFNIKTIIKNTYEACKVVEGTSRLVLRDELDSLIHTFIKKDGNIYRTIHDRLFDFLAFYFGKTMINCLIKNVTSRFIRERFLFEKNTLSEEFTIFIPERYREMYINRMLDDWSRGKLVDVFCNINMDNQRFRELFFVYLTVIELSKQKHLASSYNAQNKSTPLIQCSFIGDFCLVEWCLHHCISNVNHCRTDDRVSALFMACQNGHTDVVRILLENNADFTMRRNTGESPLYVACHQGHTEIVRMLIDNKADINVCKYTGSSPLYVACDQGHIGIVQMLIINNADTKKCSQGGISPLYAACWEGHTEVVKMLIINGADPNMCSDTGVSPLYVACLQGHSQIVEMLIDNEADITKCNNEGVSPLDIACQKGQNKILQIFIKSNAYINKCRYTGRSPLFIECAQGHSEIVQILINNKVDNSGNDKDVSPLFIACQKGYTKVVEILLNHTKADINKCIYTGETPLFIACEKGHAEVAKLLIKNKADINKFNEIEVSPVYIACQNGHTEVVLILIENKALVNKCRYTGESPLFIACERGHIEVVPVLINNNANINEHNHNRASPVSIACQNGYDEIVQLLVNKKANINTCRVSGASPLYIACQEGHTKIVHMLLQNQADIEKCRDTGESPLFINCHNGHTEVVSMLTNIMANTNKCNNENISPLYIACQNGHSKVVKLLIDHNADINICKNTGESPLYVACAEGHTEVVQMLVSNKAEVNKCLKTGEFPMLIACYNGHIDIVELLITNEADRSLTWKGLTLLAFAKRKNHTCIEQLLLGPKY